MEFTRRRVRAAARPWVGGMLAVVFIAGIWLANAERVNDASLPRPADSSALARTALGGGVAHEAVLARATYPDLRGELLATHRQLVAKWKAWYDLHQTFWLHGVGTQLYTAWNTKVTLKAINWYGFEYAPFVAGGLDKQSLDLILETLHDLHFNSIRLLFADETVEKNPIVTR